MKEITFTLENIYKIYSQMINDNNLVLAEETLLNSFEDEAPRSGVTAELQVHIDKGIMNKVINNEVIRKLIIKESTISTSTIEGEIIDEETYEKANADINSIEKDKRMMYASILSLANLLDGYVFPKKISSDDIKYIHKTVFSDKRYNPGHFKASNNFVKINADEKLMYTPTGKVDIELNKLWEFMNDKETDSHPIIKASLLHMYLALIHPFSDGNGRVIRILLNKYLTKVLGKDIYLDKYILDNIELYKENLNSFRSDDINEKNKFATFLMQLLQKYKMDHTYMLRDSLTSYVTTFKVLSKSGLLPDSKLDDVTLFIVKNYMFTISSMEHDLKITRATATKYTKILVDLKLYGEEKSGKKNLYIKIKK